MERKNQESPDFGNDENQDRVRNSQKIHTAETEQLKNKIDDLERRNELLRAGLVEKKNYPENSFYKILQNLKSLIISLKNEYLQLHSEFHSYKIDIKEKMMTITQLFLTDAEILPAGSYTKFFTLKRQITGLRAEREAQAQETENLKGALLSTEFKLDEARAALRSEEEEDEAFRALKREVQLAQGERNELKRENIFLKEQNKHCIKEIDLLENTIKNENIDKEKIIAKYEKRHKQLLDKFSRNKCRDSRGPRNSSPQLDIYIKKDSVSHDFRTECESEQEKEETMQLITKLTLKLHEHEKREVQKEKELIRLKKDLKNLQEDIQGSNPYSPRFEGKKQLVNDLQRKNQEIQDLKNT